MEFVTKPFDARLDSNVAVGRSSFETNAQARGTAIHLAIHLITSTDSVSASFVKARILPYF